jgi:hypothetical protein
MFIVNFAQCLKFVFFNYFLSSQSIMWFMFILLILLNVHFVDFIEILNSMFTIDSIKC